MGLSHVCLATIAQEVIVKNNTQSDTHAVEFELVLDKYLHVSSCPHCSLLLNDAGSTPDR